MQIERTRGDTDADEFTITNARTGAAINLTGSTVVLTVNSVRNPTDTSTQLFQITGVSSSPATGVVTFTPTAEMVNRVGVFYFDIQLTDSSGVIRTLVKDTYILTQDITK